MTLDPHKAYVTSAFQYLAEPDSTLDGLSDVEIIILRRTGDLEPPPKLRLTRQGHRKLEQQRQIRASHESK